jgi:hypothetical protein
MIFGCTRGALERALSELDIIRNWKKSLQTFKLNFKNKSK